MRRRAGRGGRKPLRSEPPGAGERAAAGGIFRGKFRRSDESNRAGLGCRSPPPRGHCGWRRPGRWGPVQERCPGQNEWGQTCRGTSTHYIWGVTFLTLSVLVQGLIELNNDQGEVPSPEDNGSVRFPYGNWEELRTRLSYVLADWDTETVSKKKNE